MQIAALLSVIYATAMGLRELERDRVIRRDGRRFVLLDVDRLRRSKERGRDRAHRRVRSIWREAQVFPDQSPAASPSWAPWRGARRARAGWCSGGRFTFDDPSVVCPPLPPAAE